VAVHAGGSFRCTGRRRTPGGLRTGMLAPRAGSGLGSLRRGRAVHGGPRRDGRTSRCGDRIEWIRVGADGGANLTRPGAAPMQPGRRGAPRIDRQRRYRGAGSAPSRRRRRVMTALTELGAGHRPTSPAFRRQLAADVRVAPDSRLRLSALRAFDPVSDDGTHIECVATGCSRPVEPRLHPSACLSREGRRIPNGGQECTDEIKWCGVARCAVAIVAADTTAGAASSGWSAGSPGHRPVSSSAITDRRGPGVARIRALERAPTGSR